MSTELMSVNNTESEAVIEARRVMSICNACRYCEGFCAVFPAMEQRREFSEQDLDYLSNLC
ncbi:tricarballylate utilization protein TcuB, partial [Pseudomonadota bacterium]